MEQLKSIIIFFLLASFIEQLVPNESYLPYVKVVLGCMLITFVLKGFQVNEVNSIENLFPTDTIENSNQKIFQEKAKDTYKTSIEDSIKKQFMAQKISANKIHVGFDSKDKIKDAKVYGNFTKNEKEIIKSIFRNVYNVKNKNINIYQQEKYD